MKKKLLVFAGLAVVVALVAIRFATGGPQSYAEKYANAGNLTADVAGIGRENTYSNYLIRHAGESYPSGSISVPLAQLDQRSGIEILPAFEGEKDVLMTSEDSVAEWSVFVPDAGLYELYMEYFPVKARGVDIERRLLINGEVPFWGADVLSFSRLWRDQGEVTQDNQGNDIRPTQTDVPEWMSASFKDDQGYYAHPFTFSFQQGMNTIRLEGINEPMAMRKLMLRAVEEAPSYEEYRAALSQAPASDVALGYKQVVEGEHSVQRSSPSLYAIYDRSSSKTTPASVAKIRLNMIGGNAWRVPGQWIEWDFEVPEDGFYNITVKARQNYKRGFVSVRSLALDGTIPFAEMENIRFAHSNNWEAMTLSDGEDRPFEFYLEQGKHTVRMEVALGELGSILDRMQDSVFRLNEIYRKVLVLTGATPDKYRDYKIDQVYPEVMQAIDLESKRLYQIVDDITAYSGQRETQSAIVLTLAQQLERFAKDSSRIPRAFVNFKDNISSFGTAILGLSEAPLDIDSITITGVNAAPDSVRENFFAKAIHETKSFAASFFEDYDSLGNVYGKGEAIEVWVLTGRDQSTILKTMIDDTFTPESGIPVNVKLVEPATVLNAVIAGNGPDVLVSAGQGEPVNYALRGAVEDLTQFPDYKKVLEDYHESATVPFWFGDSLYGLPETQYFNVMFYRKDILAELGVTPPDTWDELIDILPTIQQNNMNIAIPSTERTINNVSFPDLSTYFALLYQNGGTVYDEPGKHTLIDGGSGVDAFERFTHFFTQYSAPTIYDFVNRFRSGEMPLGIQDYHTFNTLVVFAPEIRQLWDFAPIPGTRKPDGTIDRSCHSWGTCSMMLKQTDDAVRQNAWTFMKWWSSTETQVRFGREMESVMGASARHATANVNAFRQLAWSRSQMAVLEDQWQYAVGLREVAGGYYTGRHITNAVRKVINKNEDSRETLLDYSRTINEELEKKRLEFGLDTQGGRK